MRCHTTGTEACSSTTYHLPKHRFKLSTKRSLAKRLDASVEGSRLWRLAARSRALHTSQKHCVQQRALWRPRPALHCDPERDPLKATHVVAKPRSSEPDRPATPRPCHRCGAAERTPAMRPSHVASIIGTRAQQAESAVPLCRAEGRQRLQRAAGTTDRSGACRQRGRRERKPTQQAPAAGFSRMEDSARIPRVACSSPASSSLRERA